jgi:PPK2 family polyphosphate:nucleotide phosphotransferase
LVLAAAKKEISMSLDLYRIKPGESVDLSEIDTDFDDGLNKKGAKKIVADLGKRLSDLQEALYAEGKQSLLIVMQALDAAGKDGTIEHVCGNFNPQGVIVSSFKVPSEEEADHDFLWRIHHRAPRRGMIAVFNRSHYEEALVVRVHGLKPEAEWRRAYDHMNAFEKLLADNGTRIVKIFLMISPEEQAKRFESRRQEAAKNWKFNPGDIEDRRHWKEFMAAYQEVFERCSTPWAPWYVIPANDKHYRNVAVSRILLAHLEDMDPRYPDPIPGIGDYVIPEIT